MTTVATFAGAVRADSGTSFAGEFSAGIAYLASAHERPENLGPLDHQTSPAGLTFGLAVRARRGPVVAGLGGETVATVFSHNESFLGAHAGLALGSDYFQWDILAEGGVHHVNDLGSALLIHSDAPTVTLPYAGARLGGLAGRHLGFWIYARFDLHRTTTHANIAIIDQRETATYDVGGHTIGVAVRITTGR